MSNSPTHSVFSTLANTARNTAYNTTANTACNSMRINADDLAAAIAMRQQGSSSLGSRHPLSALVALHVCVFATNMVHAAAATEARLRLTLQLALCSLLPFPPLPCPPLPSPSLRVSLCLHLPASPGGMAVAWERA